MVVNDAQVIKLIERIGEHYRTNISNRFIRPALLQAPLEKQNWDLIETLTVKMEQYQAQGFHLEELYHQIAAAAQFVAVVRRDLAPVLRNRVSGDRKDSDRIFREMAVSNFSSNLKVFADLINELFTFLVELDKANIKNRRPLYPTIPELEDVPKLLMGN